MSRPKQLGSRVIGVRLTLDELLLIDQAYELEKQPGDRGGVTAYARRALLREVKRVVDANERCNNPDCPVGCPDSHAADFGDA